MDIIVPNIIKACCVTSVSTKPFAFSWSKISTHNGQEK